MPHLTETNKVSEQMKLIKWARKQGALLIKVGDVELTFPPNIDERISIESHRRTLESVRQDNASAKAEEFLRSNNVLDDPDYIGEQQDKWFKSQSLPNYLGNEK